MRRSYLTLTLCLVLFPLALAAEDAKDGFKRERKEGETSKDALEGMTPPALQVEGWLNTDGKELDLAGLKGKVVVLDFWGTWCGPCRAAMPHLKELYAKHKEEGLVVIGVHTTNGGDEMAEYVKEESLSWPVAVDVEKKTVAAFHVDSYPDYYVIDRAGNLRVADLANSQLDRVVETLLQE
jgi:thiol-disulfide isomerase/thioredoxin